MADNKLLGQEEIDLLMRGALPAEEVASPKPELLSEEEKDALGEIGNISMGSASTTLSELLNQKVNITSPHVSITNKNELLGGFAIPYLVIKVDFSEGIEGYNLLVMKTHDASVIANLMMGGDGHPEKEELSEMEISASSEAMNMMIGTASTSLSQMFAKPINISPPESLVLSDSQEALKNETLPTIDEKEALVIVSFNMTIGDLVDTEIMQVMSLETAKEEAALLYQSIGGMDTTEPSTTNETEEGLNQVKDQDLSDLIDSLSSDSNGKPVVAPVAPVASVAPAAPAAAPPIPSFEPTPRNLDLILDIPLKVSVVLGKTKRSIKEVLSIGPGSVVELSTLADEPVEILVNNTLVAEGEVVVVNENFGVKITNIISPTERIQRLAK